MNTAQTAQTIRMARPVWRHGPRRGQRRADTLRVGHYRAVIRTRSTWTRHRRYVWRGPCPATRSAAWTAASWVCCLLWPCLMGYMGFMVGI